MSEIDKNLIARINVLAAKKKAEGLSDEEVLEQQELRARYVNEFRKGFKNQLTSIKIVDPDGNDVTPEKLKKEKLKN